MNVPLNISPSRTVVTSFAGHGSSSSIISSTIGIDGDKNAVYDDGLYVLHVSCGQAAPGSTAAVPFSCSLSDNSIHTYDLGTLRLVHSIPQAHEKQFAITDLCHTGAENNSMVVSSGTDGYVRIFDLRQQQTSTSASAAVVQMALPKREQALSVSLGYGGNLAAVGSSKSPIHFFDLRQGNTTATTNLLGSYVDAHTEEVTKVRFQKGSDGITTTSLLVSASEDGLACVFDTSQSSEEAALKSVLNVQSPLREVGFFGPAGEGLYCLTGSETMSVWHHDSAQRICDFGDSIRSHLATSASMAMDYLVGCHWNGTDLQLMAANNAGGAALFRVDAGAISLTHKMTGGHKGCIRATTWPSPTSVTKSFITAGEDARLCEWNLNQSPISNNNNNHYKKKHSKIKSRGGPARKQQNKEKKKPINNPY